MNIFQPLYSASDYKSRFELLLYINHVQYISFKLNQTPIKPNINSQLFLADTFQSKVSCLYVLVWLSFFRNEYIVNPYLENCVTLNVFNAEVNPHTYTDLILSNLLCILWVAIIDFAQQNKAALTCYLS